MPLHNFKLNTMIGFAFSKTSVVEGNMEESLGEQDFTFLS